MTNDSGGGSGNGNRGTTGTANLSLDFTHTGLHEAIVSVTDIETRELGFVVSLGTITPDYDAIKDKETFYTRNFVAGTPRLLYLSTTVDTPPDCP